MSEPLSFIAQIDRLCQQIATAIQGSELQLYASLAVIVIVSFFAFPPKDDSDQV